jgi:hypothetical protein
MSVGLSVTYQHILEDSDGLGERVAEMIYPIGIAGCLVAVLRLVLTSGLKQFSYWGLVASMIGLVFANLVFNYLGAGDTGFAESGTTAYLLGYTLPNQFFYIVSAAVALHPSMCVLADPGERKPLFSPLWRRIVVYAAAFVPVVALIFRPGDRPLQICSVLMIGMLIMRVQIMLIAYRAIYNFAKRQ